LPIPRLTGDARLLAHPEVVAAIEGTLRNLRVRKQDLEDGVAEVQTLALEYLQGKELPGDIAGWKALCVIIARNWRVKEMEKKKARAKADAGVCAEPDEHTPLEYGAPARDPLDTQRLLEVLADLFRDGQMPEHGVDILDCVQAGMTCEEIGEELGIPATTVRGRLQRMRRKFRVRIALLGLTISLILLVLAPGVALAADRGAIKQPSEEVQVPPPRDGRSPGSPEPGGELMRTISLAM
jgi:DNA-directed RNA polymerase specialized sigma24 family protein